jgi:hypothetical protein
VARRAGRNTILEFPVKGFGLTEGRGGRGKADAQTMGHPEYVWNALAAQQKTPSRPKPAPPDIEFSHFPHPHSPNLASSVNPRLGSQTLPGKRLSMNVPEALSVNRFRIGPGHALFLDGFSRSTQGAYQK